MAVTTYTSNGTPSDTLGAQGDMVIDYGGKFLWGPKGVSSWVGTANSIVGPTGSTGQTGSTPQAFNNMGVGYVPGAFQYPASTLSSAPIVLSNASSSTVPQTYTAGSNNYFVGALFTATTGTATFELYNQTAGASVYKSGSYAAGSSGISAAVGQFSSTAYPLITNNVYVWRVTGSGSFTGSAIGQFFMTLPTPLSAGVVSSFPAFQRVGSLSSTAVAMNGLGDVSQQYYSNNRASSLYTMTVSSASGSTGVANFQLYDISNSSVKYNVSDATGATISVLPGQSFTTGILNVALTAPLFYAPRVFGTGTGTYTAILNVVQ